MVGLASRIRQRVFRVAVLLATCFPAIAEASQRPKVVLILTDSQDAWKLGCYGNEEIAHRTSMRWRVMAFASRNAGAFVE
jgi:hypothetical protein